jgi:hypothetical protein
MAAWPVYSFYDDEKSRKSMNKNKVYRIGRGGFRRVLVVGKSKCNADPF